MQGRLFAIGDIHGCDVALETLLARLELKPEDTVVFLGDVVDRGPNTRRVLDLLLDLEQQCRVVFILGNHEELMLDVLSGRGWISTWLNVGGNETLVSYGGVIDDIPPEHRRFLAAGLPYWETETEIFVHAGLEPDVPLVEQIGPWLRWSRLEGNEPPHSSGKRVICGHTAQRGGEPCVFEGWVCLDTYVYGSGYLSALDVRRNILYQANQRGEFRTRRLGGA